MFDWRRTTTNFVKEFFKLYKQNMQPFGKKAALKKVMTIRWWFFLTDHHQMLFFSALDSGKIHKLLSL